MFASRRFAASLFGKTKPLSLRINNVICNQTKHLSMDDDGDDDAGRINKIPNTKGFEFLRNPKLNKVMYV